MLRNITSTSFVLINFMIVYSLPNDVCEQLSFNLLSTTLPDVKTSYINRRATLPCCANSNDSIILWFKNGTPIKYNKQYGITSFYLNKDSKKISSDSVMCDDIGNYTCIVRNGIQEITTSIKLIPTRDFNGEGEPKPVFVTNLEDQYAETGDSLNISCAANIGFSEKRRNESVVFWEKDDLSQLISVDWEIRDIDTENCDLGNGWTKGSNISFPKISKEHFGNYTCTVSIGKERIINKTIILKEGKHPDTQTILKSSYIAAAIIFVVFITVFVITITGVIRWKLDILLFLKDHYGKLEENDDKLYDVFVLYDDKDSDFAFTLVKKLEKTYQLNCFIYDRNAMGGEFKLEVLRDSIRKSRRFVMVLSPSLLNNPWSTHCLYMAIETLLNLHSNIICIMKEITMDDISKAPECETSEKTLGQMLKVIKKVYWECPETKKKCNKDCENTYSVDLTQQLNGQDIKETKIGSQRFWKSLLLYLPPRKLF